MNRPPSDSSLVTNGLFLKTINLQLFYGLDSELVQLLSFRFYKY